MTKTPDNSDPPRRAPKIAAALFSIAAGAAVTGKVIHKGFELVDILKQTGTEAARLIIDTSSSAPDISSIVVASSTTSSVSTPHQEKKPVDENLLLLSEAELIAHARAGSLEHFNVLANKLRENDKTTDLRILCGRLGMETREYNIFSSAMSITHLWNIIHSPSGSNILYSAPDGKMDTTEVVMKALYQEVLQTRSFRKDPLFQQLIKDNFEDMIREIIAFYTWNNRNEENDQRAENLRQLLD